MNQNMKKVEIYRKTTTVDDYNEKVGTTTKVGEAEMFIYTSTGSTQLMNDVMSVQSTHMGLTKSSFSFKCGDYIKSDGNTYKVDFITITKRMIVLNLELDKCLG